MKGEKIGISTIVFVANMTDLAFALLQFGTIDSRPIERKKWQL